MIRAISDRRSLQREKKPVKKKKEEVEDDEAVLFVSPSPSPFSLCSVTKKITKTIIWQNRY